MKFHQIGVVAMAIAVGVLLAANCGDVTKKTYSDENCKKLEKTEELPAKDSKLCNNQTASSLSYKITCESSMTLQEYTEPNCKGEMLEVALSPPNRCVKDLDTGKHIILSWTG